MTEPAIIPEELQSSLPQPQQEVQPARKRWDVLVTILGSDSTQRQLFKAVDLSGCLAKSGLILDKLLTALKNEYALPLQGCEIQYYLTGEGIWLQCGTDPIGTDIYFTRQEIEQAEVIQIRAQIVEVDKNGGSYYLQQLIETEVDEYQAQKMIELSKRKREEERVEKQRKREQEIEKVKVTRGRKKIEKEAKEQKGDKKRMNERPIGYVIDKIVEWRNFFLDKDEGKGMCLKDAADKVGISKKSLDDYVLHIRKGFKFSFNFNEHRHSKIGVLRQFVKKREKQLEQAKIELSRKLSMRKEHSNMSRMVRSTSRRG